ncbi:MAG: histidine phosphatase family protein, partial [Thermoleophilia bacterium]|nr:histidine phosphatase family protein [Thermoleophilia bacterium]
LVTSEVPRALETAAILAGRTGLHPVIDAGWNELRAGEILAGPPEAIRHAVTSAYREAGQPGARFLGGESFAGFAKRVEQALDRLLAESGWSRAAVVTHEPALRYLLARCHGRSLDGLGMFALRTGSASVLEWAAGACGIETATVLIVNAAASDLPRLR